MKELMRTVLLVAIGWQSCCGTSDAQHLDVLIQVVGGKIAIGGADFDGNTWTIGTRVFQRQFLSNFRTNDPGFASLATGNPLLEPGVIGFPSNHNVDFDLVPMQVGDVRANFFFWDGTDIAGNGLATDDVRFVRPPTGVSWNLLDDRSNLFKAEGTDVLVPGGLIQRSSSDTNPGDGIDTGSVHSHLLIRVDDGDGNASTSPAQGVYMVALQVRSAGFETSDPFVFVHRTSTVSNQARDVAAEWAEGNLSCLFAVTGDYNDNGQVANDDFAAWQSAFGTTASHTADGNCDGIVDAADFTLWRDHVTTLGGMAPIVGSVPEPTAWWGIWLAGALVGRPRYAQTHDHAA